MIYVFLADGFETIEALTPIDYLRRAGIALKTVGVGVTGKTVISAHKVPVLVDITEEELTTEDMEGIVLPGGMPGTFNLERSAAVQNAIEYCNANGKLISAICAAPSILGHKNLLIGKEAVCFPGFEKDLYGAVISKKFAVKDGNIITAKGAGAASEFSFEIIKYLLSDSESKKVRDTVQTCY